MIHSTSVASTHFRPNENVNYKTGARRTGENPRIQSFSSLVLSLAIASSVGATPVLSTVLALRVALVPRLLAIGDILFGNGVERVEMGMELAGTCDPMLRGRFADDGPM